MAPFRRTLAGLLLGCLTLLAPGYAATPDELSEAVYAALNEGRVDDARPLALQFLLAVKGSGQANALALAHHMQAELAFHDGNSMTAAGHYRMAGWLSEDLQDQAGLAYCLLGQGLCLRAMGKYQQAAEVLGRSADTYHAVGNIALAGRAALQAGDSLQRYGEFAKALERAQQSREWLETIDLNSNLVDAWYVSGVVQSLQGDNDAAKESYEKGLELAKQLGEPGPIGRGLNNLAMLSQTMGDLNQAEAWLREAMELMAVEDTVEFAATLRGNLATVVHALGRSEEAEQLYREAVEIAKDEPDTRATQMCSLANMLLELGRIDEAMDLLAEAGDIRLQREDLLGLAAVRTNLGNAYSRRGDFRSALNEFFSVVEVYELVGLKESLATTYNNIGRIYDMQGDLEHAIVYFDKAITLAEEVQNLTLMAIALNNMGLSIYNRLKPFLPLEPDAPETADSKELRSLLGQAETSFDTAAEALKLTGDQRYLATILNNIGQLAADLGDLDKAAETLDQALKLHRAMSNRIGVSQTAANVGLLYLRLGRHAESKERLNEALDLSRQIGDRETESSVLCNIALLALAEGDEKTAIDRLYECVDLIEQRRAMVGGGEGQQRQFLAGNIQPYLMLIQLLVKQQQPAQAFAIAERAKGRALLDMMQEGRVDLRDRLPEEEANKLAELDRAVSAAQVELARLSEAANSTPAEIEAAKEAVETARNDLATEESRLHALYPASIAAGTQPLGFHRAAHELPPDTALFQYATGVDRGFLFVLTNAGAGRDAKAYQVVNEDETITDELAAFREACANPRRRYKSQGAALYDRLVRPALAELPEGIHRLIIIPDGPLYDCPFQALVDKDTDEFLVDQYELVYGASASLVVSTLQLGDERRAQPAGEGVLVIADPDFTPLVKNEPKIDVAGEPKPGEETPGEAKPSTAKTGLGVVPDVARDTLLVPLPGTRAEADAIASMMPKVQELTGRAASETAVKQSLAGHRILHFATHGLLDPDNPLYSAIAVAAPSAPGEDGFLEGRELARMSLDAELVCLSACQSGRGQTLAGEGLIGLPWAFFVARVPTQVVSLWSVDDFMTMQLMKRFYAHLAAGEPKGASLRAAGQELRKDTITGPDGQDISGRHPYYWAPFVMLGDWR